MDVMTALIQDVRFAVRSLGKNPAYAAMAVLTLGIGIGAATALFSVVHGILLRPLPYPEPDRIVQVWEVNSRGNPINVTDPNFADWMERSRSFAGMAQFQSGPSSVVGGEEPVRQMVAWVSRDFFRVMGVQPAVGRAFAPDEQQPGGTPAVVVGHAFWQDHLGGARDLSGRALSFGDDVYQVVGVMPPGFEFPAGAQLWTARELRPVLTSRTAHNWQVVARLAPGVSLERAQQEMSALSRSLKQEHGDDISLVDAALVPLHEHLVGGVRPILLVLLGAAGFLLLVAVANVTNLSLARMAARRREMAVRVALGASRWRLLGPTLSESLTLSLAGGLLGILLAGIGLRALLAVEPGNLPRTEEIGLSPGALGFALTVAVVTAVALALIAALRAGSTDLRSGLASGDRTRTGSASARRVQDGLVAAQVALTFVLLVGAGLLGRSIISLLDVDLGFRTDSVVAMSLSHSGARDQSLSALHHEIVTRLRAIPGVEAAGGSNRVPLMWGGSDGTFIIQNHPDEIASFDDWGALTRVPERSGQAGFRVASEGFFRALGIPLVGGRLFDDRDVFDAPHVAVINESLARTRWPGEDPLGKLINFANMDGDFRPMMVIGIVGDVRDFAIDAPPVPTVYGSYRQRPRQTSEFTYVVSGAGGAASLSAAARRVAADVAPTAPPRLRTIEEVVAAPLAPRRFSLVLLAAFGATALLLSAMGVYGLMSYGVTQRRREIGIRVALGAMRSRVLGMIVRQGATLAVLGVAVGVAAAAFLTRYIAHQLYGVETRDVATFAAATVFLLGVAALASYIPARRAARVDPMIALREE
jgi:putative ABC transport system permease protein